jgi:uncharacterized protein (DUF983 family)
MSGGEVVPSMHRSDRGISTRSTAQNNGFTDNLPPVPWLRAALAWRCPRCGRGPLFSGLVNVRPACAICGLDLSAQDAGDGPAVFVILFLGLIVVALTAVVEIKFSPPIWVHLVLWTPLILVGGVAMLRPFKAGLIALQYRHHLLGARSQP